MGLADQPDTMARWMADMERRMRTQETATRAANTSITDSGGKELVRLDRDGIKIFDAAGDTRVQIGLIDEANGRYGLLVRDGDGSTQRFRVDERGLLTPYLVAPVVDATDFAVVTSASFVVTHRAQFEVVTHEGLYCWVNATSDAGTTGEMRLYNASTAQASEAKVIPALSGGTLQQFRWLHGVALNVGPAYFEVQARRTGGAGNINIYRSPGMWMTDPTLCVADGIA